MISCLFLLSFFLVSPLFSAATPYFPTLNTISVTNLNIESGGFLNVNSGTITVPAINFTTSTVQHLYSVTFTTQVFYSISNTTMVSVGLDQISADSRYLLKENQDLYSVWISTELYTLYPSSDTTVTTPFSQILNPNYEILGNSAGNVLLYAVYESSFTLKNLSSITTYYFYVSPIGKK